MSNAALQLESFFIDRISVETWESDETIRPGSVSQRGKFDIVEDPGNAESFTGRLEYLINPEKDDFQKGGYRCHIVITGFFSIAAETSADLVKAFKVLNAPAMLYAIMRGHIASLTGQARHGTLILPAVNFQALFMDYVKEVAGREPKTSPRKRKRKNTQA